jgi:hypothetical protein
MLGAGAVFWLALLVCFWLYRVGVNGPTILDDAVNLQELKSLEENPRYLLDFVLGNGAGLFGRPLAMFSFALSWLSGPGDVVVFKQHNLLLHLLNASLVFLLSLRVLELSNHGRSAWTSLLVALLWLFAPLHLSTVLYVIQRMAQLSALFVLAGLYLYAVGRQRLEKTGRGWGWLLGAQFCGVLAALSKENGALYWPLQMLFEFCFHSGTGAGSPAARIVRTANKVLLATGIVVVLGALIGYADIFIGPYERREFTLLERVLTEARVLWQYVWAFAWPMQPGFGVFHDDIVVSTGLFAPPQTLVSVCAWIAVVAGAVIGRRSPAMRTCAFGVLFYAVSHSMESTLLPLELYFEHRNYLAVFGLALAVVCLVDQLASRLQLLGPTIWLALPALIISAIIATGLRASIWGNEYLLVIAQQREHPRSARANMEMATKMTRLGDVGHATVYASIAYEASGASKATARLRDIALYCIANRWAPQVLFDELDSDAERLNEASANEALTVLVNLAVNDRCPSTGTNRLADLMERRVISGGLRLSTGVYAAMAVLANDQGQYKNAAVYTELWLQQRPDEVKALLMHLYFSLQLREYSGAVRSASRLHRALDGGQLTREQADDLELLEESIPTEYRTW